MREEAPGLEVEKGVDQVSYIPLPGHQSTRGKADKQIFSDYLDAFVDEAARGAIRLAKHRKGNTVEVKDMALFLGMSYVSSSRDGSLT
jgi:hypothetical protein